MTWIFIALIAYIINAFVFVVDKYLLDAPIPRPFAYAFWISLLSLFVVALIPFGVYWPDPLFLGVAILSGVSNFLGLIFLYRSIKLSDVSIATTKIGALSVVFTYIFSILILGKETVSLNLHSLLLFAVGIYFLSRLKFNMSVLSLAIFGGIFMGLSVVLLKWNFNHSDFINGVFWTRMGFVFPALASLPFSSLRSQALSQLGNAKSSSRLIFVANKILATIGFILIYYAISLGDVSTVNALSGFQFIFVLILAIIFSNRLKFKEDLNINSIINKSIGVALILLGFWVSIK